MLRVGTIGRVGRLGLVAALRSSFSPAALFAAGEPGLWLDPSDLTTLFQDTAGTTPVTTAGQTVALALDKSRGLVLGSELAVGAWTLVTGSNISGSGQAITASAAPDNARIRSPLPTVSGPTYEITINVTSISAGSLRLFTGGTVIATYNSTGFRTLKFQSVATTFDIVAVGASTTASATISVRELPGNHATQSVSASRPTYQIVNGLPCLVFDGVDDFLVTPTITPNIDKVQVFAGVRKNSDAAQAILAEMSANVNTNAGSLYFAAPESTGASGNYSFSARGSASIPLPVASGVVLAPNTSVLSALADIATDTRTLRRNGAVAATSSAADMGTGNFLAYPLYLGRRGGTSLPFNGQLYSLIVRFGANLGADQITATEAWVNARTGAY